MCVDNKFHMLFVADNHGFVSNWNIENYARHHVETEAPTCNLNLLLNRVLALTS